MSVLKRLLPPILFTLLAYLLFAVQSLPLTQLQSQLQQKLPELHLQGLHGSLSAGTVDHLRFKDYDFTQLHWQWQASALLRLQLGFLLTAHWQNSPVSTTLQLSPGGTLSLLDLKGNIAAQNIPIPRNLFPLPIQLGGSISITMDEIRLSQGLDFVQGHILWQDAAISAPIRMQLASIHLQLHSDDGAIIGDYKDDGKGPWLISGKLTMNPDTRQYHNEIDLAVRDRQKHELQQMLGFLGRPDADGHLRLQHSGKIPQ